MLAGVMCLAIPFLPSASGQFYADTLPLPKNVLIEEFTAVHCSFCPAAHLLLDSLLTEHPDRVFGTAMHPANTAYTAPYAGSPDFRRSYLDAFFSVPFATDSVRFFPGAFINRRQWEPGRRERYTEDWRAETDSMLSEAAPLNVGLHVWYNPILHDYTVIAEVYYTDTVNFQHTLLVYLTEDSLVAEQNNGGVNYIHRHVFREGLCAQWGDSLGGTTLPGTLHRDTLYFADPASAYDWTSCHFIAFVRNAEDEEVVNVMQVPVQEVLITARGEMPDAAFSLNVYPNPCTDHFYFKMEALNSSIIRFQLRDLTGRLWYEGVATPGESLRVDLPETWPCGFFIMTADDGQHMMRQGVIRIRGQ